MTFFPDLSDYVYARSESVITTKNVGWLDADIEFPIGDPSEGLLESLWQLGLISVRPTRGLHACPICAPRHANVVERGGARIVLGSAEIRVFAPGRALAFAAPNLIYHYVSVHHYAPPEAFLEALQNGPRPDTPEYGQILGDAQLRWEPTPILDDDEDEILAVKAIKNGDRVEVIRIPKV